jgi:hypothetical protein
LALSWSVAKGQRVQVVAAGVADLDVLGQPVDQRFLLDLGTGLEVQVGHADELLHIGPADQRAAEHGDLLLDIGLHGQAGHQGLEDRLRVDVDARRGLVLVGDAPDDDDADDGHDPGHHQRRPAELPHAAHDREQLSDDFFHGARAPGRGSACSKAAGARRAGFRSEQALRDDQDVARAHLDVGRHVAALDQVLQAHRILLVAFGRAQDGGLVAGGEVGQAADAIITSSSVILFL